VVRSGQNVGDYGFSMALIAGVVDGLAAVEGGDLGECRAAMRERAGCVGSYTAPATSFEAWGHSFREHSQRYARVAGFSVRSGRVIRAWKSGLGEEDLRRGEPFDHVHGPLAARARPGSRLLGERRICSRRWLVEQAAAEG